MKVNHSGKPARGQTLVNYGLILALIAIVVVAIVSALGGSVNDKFSQINDGFGGGTTAVADPCEGITDLTVTGDSAYFESTGSTLTYELNSTICGDTSDVDFVDWRVTSSAGSNYGLVWDGGPGTGLADEDHSSTDSSFPADISGETVSVTVYLFDGSFSIIAQDTINVTVD